MPLWKDHEKIGGDELSMSEAADLLELERTRAFRVIKLYSVEYRYVTPKLIAINRASLEALIASGRRQRGERGKDRRKRKPVSGMD
jgi:hypothetical protein